MATPIERMNREFLEGRRDLRAFLMLLDPDPLLVEDILQEVWVLLAEQAMSGREVEHMGPWCRTVARRAWIRHRRAARRERPDDEVVADRIDTAFAADPWDQDTWGRHVEALRSCLAGIDPATRRLLERRYLEQAGMPDLAREFSSSESTLLVRLSRLRERLRICVDARLRMVLGHG